MLQITTKYIEYLAWGGTEWVEPDSEVPAECGYGWCRPLLDVTGTADLLLSLLGTNICDCVCKHTHNIPAFTSRLSLRVTEIKQ